MPNPSVTDHATAWLDISLDALTRNYRALQRRAPRTQIAAVVKADAYGLGMVAVARHLVKQGALTFFVARICEGVTLRAALGSGIVIYVLDSPTPADIAAYVANDLRPVLNMPASIELWLSVSEAPLAALHIDTGMNRLGVRYDEVGRLPAELKPRLGLIMSHLACSDHPSDPMNEIQHARFEAASTWADVPRSFSNSGGLFLKGDYHYDVARPGICLYGGGPEGSSHPEISPVVTLTARILQVRKIMGGESIGYSHAFTATEDMKVATIGIGYADGLMRALSDRGYAVAAGEKRRLLGRISMDLACVDITGLDLCEGDTVELLGAGYTIDDMARDCGTIAYEILTRLGSRLPRRYR